jgi:hypothetical protein
LLVFFPLFGRRLSLKMIVQFKSKRSSRRSRRACGPAS